MAPPTWATAEQTEFLYGEDPTWILIKASSRTLKSFYTQTTATFLQRWPRTPDEATLKRFNGDLAKAQAYINHETWKQIANWYGNLHRLKKSLPAANKKPLLDLAGKNTRKKPPLQKWQAFSVLYYRPLNSPLRAEVRSSYERREEPTTVEFLANFLPSDADIAAVDYLTFLGAFLRERCTRLSSDEEAQVQDYIQREQVLAAERREHPWFLDDDFEDKPLLAENRYIQARIDELPRVAQRAVDEIEKCTGFKAILLVGGLTPIDGGAISTNLHTSGYATTTGLTFAESWVGCAEMRDAFSEWLKMAYTEDEKRRREGFSASSLVPDPVVAADNVTPNGMASDDKNPSGPTPDNTTPGDIILDDPAPDRTTSGDTNSDNETSNSSEPNNTTADDPTSISDEPVPTTPGEDSATDTSPVSPRTPATIAPDLDISPVSATQKGTKSPAPPEMTTLTTPARHFEHDQSYPSFITPGMIDQLNSVDGGLRWTEMVKSYLTLEGQYRSRRAGRLSLQHRPEEVTTWARQRNLPPAIADIQKFCEDWITWWGSCQPKWRSVQSWPYTRDGDKDNDWDRLNVTGASGLFAFVMSTSWWAASPDLDSHRGTFDSAVEDLHWVIQNLIDFNSQLPVPGPGQVDSAAADHFPGHGMRDPGKRKIKPTPKVSNRT